MARKALYTEADVRAMPRGTELVLGPGDVATPSALDQAHARGIRVVYRSSRGESAAPAPQNAMWKRMLASEGTYVVQVKGGRAQVFRLREGAAPELLSEAGA